MSTQVYPTHRAISTVSDMRGVLQDGAEEYPTNESLERLSVQNGCFSIWLT
jgi:hypothetical protein